ncbi:MAG TPA: hypothetical protein VL463_11475 [Kofleriaceae bacterium]|nr:hypothetical protein [Kofleriaceae bacterium]
MRYLWVIIAAVVIAIRSIPPAADPPAAAAESVRLVPITDDESTAIIDEIMLHPSWRLQFGEAWYSCVDQGFLNVYTITDGENVAWDARDMPPRRLSLTDGERATLRSITSLGVKSLDGDAHRDPFLVSIGDFQAGRMSSWAMQGARIDRESPAGRALEDIFRAATDRYLQARADFVGALVVTDQIGRPIDLRDLDLRARVDLADWALAQPETSRRAKVDAWILVGGHRVGVTKLDGRPALWDLQRLLP